MRVRPAPRAAVCAAARARGDRDTDRVRAIGLRREIDNVFNQVQFATVDSTARFDAAGNQVNTRFGQVITTRTPRVMQIALRFMF